MDEQITLVETMNTCFHKTAEFLKNPDFRWEPWSLYKGTGDGAIFVFGQLLTPKSICDAIKFATWSYKNIIERNKKLPPAALNHLCLRMTLSYGKIYVTTDLRGYDATKDREKENYVDIIGDPINVASRLASAKETKGGGIFIDDTIYHNLQINREVYYVNEDKSIPSSGELSDIVIGKKPDANNFLYITQKGLFKTKDRIIKAYGISGRLEGVDIVS
jgi:class 3 adenylate cyclase